MGGILCFKVKTAENISFDNGFISKVWILVANQIMFQWQNCRKYFVWNGRRLEKTRDFDYMVFGHFKNVHFDVCTPSILNAKLKNTKIRVVTIMLIKHIFTPKKMWLNFFGSRFVVGIHAHLG